MGSPGSVLPMRDDTVDGFASTLQHRHHSALRLVFPRIRTMSYCKSGGFRVDFGVSKGGTVDVNVVNPFVNSVVRAFETMLDLPVTRGKLRIGTAKVGTSSIVATIGIAGSSRGTIALEFPEKTAIHVVRRLLGNEQATMDDSVTDAVGELVNIVAGSAKAELSEGLDMPLSLSLPSMIRGSQFELHQPADCKWIDVPFESDAGPFTLKVVMTSDKK